MFGPMSTMTAQRAKPLTTGTLRNMLRDALGEEDYMSAAVLRDELKEREGEEQVLVRPHASSVCSVCGRQTCTGHATS